MAATINASTSSGIVTSADNSGQLELQTANTTRLTINSSGNVGIGTASPSVKLNVYDATNCVIQSNSDAISQIVAVRYSNDTNSANIIARKARGTFASPSAVNSGDTAGSFTAQVFAGTGNRPVGQMNAIVDTYTSDTNVSGYLTFSTNGGSTTVTERMRIDSAGNVGIGTSSPSGKLDVTGSLGKFTIDSSGTLASLTYGAANYIRASTASGNLNLGAYDYVTIQTGSGFSERMRIDTSGNVGIGTSSPVAKMAVVQAGAGYSSQATFKGDIQIAGGPASLQATGGLEYLTSTFGSGYGWKISSIDSAGVHLVFGTRQNSASWTEMMRIDSSGNVGIGASSPGTYGNLEVSRSSGYVSTATWSGAGAVAVMAANANSEVRFGSVSNHPMWLMTNGAERMRIDSSGNVGIGTSSPTTKLQVYGDVNTAISARVTNNNAGASASAIYSFGNNADGNIGFIGCVSSAAPVPNGVYVANRISGPLLLLTNDTERMRIDSSGNVGIGTTSPSSFAKLAVIGTTATNVFQMATAGNTSGLYMTPNDGGQFTLNSYGSGLTINSTTTTGVVTVGTQSTERMRIDSSGYASGTVNGLGRGIYQSQQYYRLNSTVAGANATGAQSIFGVGVTLVGSTQYEFEIQFAVSKTAGTTSHTFSIGFGGTATVNNIGYEVTAAENTTGANAVASASPNFYWFNTAASSLYYGARTSATQFNWVLIKGTVSINAGGTFIPQYTLSAAPGGAYTTQIGSYIKIAPLAASGANVSIGSWA